MGSYPKHFTLRYLGVPIDGLAFMFSDNQSVITNSTLSHSSLRKRLYALAYHKVREAVTAGLLKFYYIGSKHNPANVLTRNTNYSTLWPLLRPLLFWAGDTKSMPSIAHHTQISKPMGSDRFQSGTGCLTLHFIKSKPQLRCMSELIHSM